MVRQGACANFIPWYYNTVIFFLSPNIVSDNCTDCEAMKDMLEAYDARLQKLQKELEDLKQQDKSHFKTLQDLNSYIRNPPNGSLLNPSPSCKFVDGDASGWYWLQSDTKGFAFKAYCDLTNARCGTRGWMRVANMNMSDPRQHCPSGFRYTSGTGYRGCGTIGSGCIHTSFPSNGVCYSKVCGKVNAY